MFQPGPMQCLTWKQACYNLCPFQDGVPDATRTRVPDVGRSSPWSGPTGDPGTPCGSASIPGAARCPHAGPRDDACRGGSAVAARQPDLRSRAPRPRRRLPRVLPDSPIQRASRSRPSARRSRPPERPRSAMSGARGSRGESDQPHPRPSGCSVGRQVSRAAAQDAARVPERARVRAQQLAEARCGSARARSTLVRGLVRRLADPPTAAGGTGPGVSTAHLACQERVAAPWPDRCR